MWHGMVRAHFVDQSDLDRSPTVNFQEMSPFLAPVSRSMSCQIMLVGSSARLISSMSSSHSMLSPWPWL